MDCFDGIAAALEVMGNVEFEFGVTRIGRGENLIDFFGTLAERTHVVVIAERNSKFGSLLADRGQQLSESLVIFGGNRAIPRAVVGDLQIFSAGGFKKLCVRDMLRNLLGFGSVDVHSAARKRDECEFVLREQIGEFLRALEFIDGVGANLNSRESKR